MSRPYFVTNAERMTVELDDAYILLHQEKLTSMQDLLPVLERVGQTGKPLVIVAEDVDGEALATLVVNRLRGGLKAAAAKAPAFGDRRKAMLQDIAVLTGGSVIHSELGVKLENVTLDMLGTAKRVEMSKDETVIIGGGGTKKAIDERCQQLRFEIETTDSEYDQERFEERLAKLVGGVAVLRVGGDTEIEVKEKKELVDDAMRATRAAVEEGVVPGGGVALLFGVTQARQAQGRQFRPGSRHRHRAESDPHAHPPHRGEFRCRRLARGRHTPRSAEGEPGLRCAGGPLLRHDRSRHPGSGEGRAHGASGRRLHRRPPDRHRSRHRRNTREGASDAARWRHARSTEWAAWEVWAEWVAWAEWVVWACRPPPYAPLREGGRVAPFFVSARAIPRLARSPSQGTPATRRAPRHSPEYLMRGGEETDLLALCLALGRAGLFLIGG